MRPQPVIIALAALFASAVVAQDATTTADGDVTTTADAETTAETTAAETTAAETTAVETTADETTADETTADETTADETTADEATSTTDASTEETTDATSTTEGTAPALTTTSDSNGDTGLPTLAGQYSYPPPTVPPTNNAPYMQPSSMPEGTVFIAVGAILGAIGVAVLIWRAVVACLLHRSVKRAALAQHIANDKASYPAPSAPFYKYTDHASSASLGNMGAGRGARRTQRGPIPSATPSQSNLFFSPTAPGGASNAGNRESRFLPSGFYAAGPGTPQQGHEHSISLTNLRPNSLGHALSADPSPPESPNLGPRHDPTRRNTSSSTLNLNRPLSQRAPSAYLNDLLADQPEQFPPPGGFHQPRSDYQNRI